MANRWVEYDLIDKTHAEETIDRIYAAFEEQEGQSGATAGVNLAEKPKITTKPKPEPANSLEQAERREKTTEMLIEDRQSEDPTTQAAASALMTCDADVDPLSGADDPALSLIHISEPTRPY